MFRAVLRCVSKKLNRASHHWCEASTRLSKTCKFQRSRFRERLWGWVVCQACHVWACRTVQRFGDNLHESFSVSAFRQTKFVWSLLRVRGHVVWRKIAVPQTFCTHARVFRDFPRFKPSATFWMDVKRLTVILKISLFFDFTKWWLMRQAYFWLQPYRVCQIIWIKFPINREFPQTVNNSEKLLENLKSSVPRGIHRWSTLRFCCTQLLVQTPISKVCQRTVSTGKWMAKR